MEWSGLLSYQYFLSIHSNQILPIGMRASFLTSPSYLVLPGQELLCSLKVIGITTLVIFKHKYRKNKLTADILWDNGLPANGLPLIYHQDLLFCYNKTISITAIHLFETRTLRTYYFNNPSFLCYFSNH